MPTIGKRLSWWPLAISLAGLLAGTGWLRAAQHAPEEFEIPAVGRPVPFYDAVGHQVSIEARTDRVELHRQEALVLTLTVRNLLYPGMMRRPDLRELADLGGIFQIEDLATEDVEPSGTRVFRYRLRPRTAGNLEIPELTLSYYDPRVPQPPDRPDLPFRKARSAVVPLRVLADPPVSAADVGPLPIPDFAREPVQSTGGMPAWLILAAWLLPPWAALMIWLRSRHQQRAAQRQRQQRRSRAGRVALRQLSSADIPPDRVAAVIRAYLHDRWAIPESEVNDVARRECLVQAGVDERTLQDVQAFLTLVDMARFGPDGSRLGDIVRAEARAVVERLEMVP